MTRVKRSIFFSAVERYASLALYFVSTAVLARLLDPSEFGVYAVASALTTVVGSAFQEFGGANYVIQKPDLSRESLRTAFSITFLISFAIGIILCFLAGPAAKFFGQDGLRVGIAVSALNFALTPFSGTLTALLRREMEFGALALCNLTAGAAGAAVSVVLALMKFSYMAPIWGGVASSFVLTIMLVVRRADSGIFRPCFADCRDVARFGAISGGVVVLNVFYSLSPQLFLARTLDFASVGIYSRAGNITQIFDRLVVQVLNPVIMPTFTASRTAGQDLRRVYLDAAQLLSVVQWPALIVVTIVAQPLIGLWLGARWLEIVPLVQILCVANMALFAACLSYPVLVAVGRVRDALLVSFVSLPLSLLVILGASFFGVTAVAASSLLTLPFQAAVALNLIARRLKFTWMELAAALIPSAVTTAFTAAGMAACTVFVESKGVDAALGLACASVAAAVFWLVGLFVTGHPMLRHIQLAASVLAVKAPSLWTRTSAS